MERNVRIIKSLTDGMSATTRRARISAAVADDFNMTEPELPFYGYERNCNGRVMVACDHDLYPFTVDDDGKYIVDGYVGATHVFAFSNTESEAVLVGEELFGTGYDPVEEEDLLFYNVYKIVGGKASRVR